MKNTWGKGGEDKFGREYDKIEREKIQEGTGDLTKRRRENQCSIKERNANNY